MLRSCSTSALLPGPLPSRLLRYMAHSVAVQLDQLDLCRHHLPSLLQCTGRRGLSGPLASTRTAPSSDLPHQSGSYPGARSRVRIVISSGETSMASPSPTTSILILRLPA